MSFGLVFWLIMLIWLLFWLWDWRAPTGYGPVGNTLMLFVLFLLLGWRVFGAPVHP
jgi:hypothetical protein